MRRPRKAILTVLIAGLVLVNGCTSSPEARPADAATSETRETAAEPQSGQDQSEEVLSEAREHYQELVNGVEQAYNPFYELYDYGSQDLGAMQKAAGVVADAMRTFTSGLKSYDWPPPVKDTTVNAVVASYGVDAKAWDGVASASTVEEMVDKLVLMDASVAEANALTNELRIELGLTAR